MQRFSNNYDSQLVADISDSDTTIFVGSISGLPDISAPEDFFIVTICDSSKYPETDIEIVKCLSVKSSDSSLEVVRGQEGTAAIEHFSGECISLRVTANSMEMKSEVGHSHTISDITDLDYPVDSVNGKTGAVVLSPSDVGAAPSDHDHTISDITDLDYPVDSVNGKTGAVTLSASDVGASPSGHDHTMSDITDLAFPVTSVNTKTGAVSLSHSDVGAAPSSHDHTMSDISDLSFPVDSVNGETGDVSLSAADVGAAPSSHDHTMSDISDLDFPVDSVNGKTGAVSLVAADVGAAPASHTHDDRYYTETESNSRYATKSHEHTISDITDLDYPVDSVNGKTGAVSLTASDVGALPTGGKAADSDKLDNHDSTYFARTATVSTSDPSGGTDGDVWYKV